MPNKSESYIVSFDHFGEDTPTLVVAKYDGGLPKVINVITGKEASRLYNQITNHKNEEEKQ